MIHARKLGHLCEGSRRPGVQQFYTRPSSSLKFAHETYAPGAAS